MMNSQQRVAIRKFADAIKDLKDTGVIRSDRYLGDIAEFLCADELGIVLSENLLEDGHDGMRGNIKVQVKYGGGKKKNVKLGNPDSYQELYVVLGKDSVLRSAAHEGDFLVYKLTSEEIRNKMRQKSGDYSCGASRFSGKPDHVIRLDVLESGVSSGPLIAPG